MKEYDIVVIGAGSGGITAAVTASGFGKKVLLIDKNKPGGECTWSGCIPSKALINESKKVHTIRSRVTDINYDSKEALDYVHKIRESVYSHETPEVFIQSGIDYLQGQASFKNSRILLVNGEEVHGKKYIISTGSSPFVPPIPGLDSVPYLTNESVFELERLPESMIILGGGPIGIELAQAVSRLGTRVQLVEMMPVLVFREEKEFSLSLQKILTEEGVSLHLGAKAVLLEGSDNRIRLTYEKEDSETTIEAASLLVAIGRTPNLKGLGLDNTGMAYNRKGIETNRKLQTSLPHVYAIGDVTGPYQFSHMANAQGIQAVQNAILPFKRNINYDHVAWVTFTEPELARAGMTEEEARKTHGDSVRVYHYDFSTLDRSMTAGKTNEKMKVVLNKRGKILGISILADRAGELIGEAQLMKTAGLNYARMGTVVHPYPTYSEAFSKIGKKVMVDNLLNHPLVKLFRKGRGK